MSKSFIKKYKTNFGTVSCFANDIVFNQSLRSGKLYEQNIILEKIIPYLKKRNIKIILDIGAHIGSHSLIYSKIYPDSTIYCFEPQKEIYQILETNIEDNNLHNVICKNICLGHKICDTNMSKFLYDGYNLEVSYNTKKTFNYGGIGLGLEGEKVKMLTVDSLDLEGCDFIKLDTEGSEILVLIGAKETIKKFKPIIFFEHTDKNVSEEMKKSLNIDFKIPDIKNWLSDLGYKLIQIDENNILGIYN